MMMMMMMMMMDDDENDDDVDYDGDEIDDVDHCKSFL